MTPSSARDAGASLAPPAPAGPQHTSLGARIVRNVFALGIGQVFTWLSTAALVVVLPRFLGDVNLGKLAFAGAYTAYFGLLTGTGTATFLTKEVARKPSLAGSYSLNAVAMRLTLCVLASLLGILTINLLSADDLTRRTVYLLFIGMTLGTLYGTVAASLQGLQEMRAVAVSQAATIISSAGSVTVLLVTGHGLLAVALATSLSNAAGLAVALFVLFRRARLRALLHLGVWRTLFMGGLPFFVWSASLLVYGKVDLLMLSALSGDAVVGWYAAAYRITSIPQFIPVIMMTAVFPALSAAEASEASFNAMVRRAVQMVLLATVPMATGLLLLSDKLIELLGYPSGFVHSVPLIVILALHIPMVAADMIVGTALNARDQQRQWAMVAVTAAVLNPGLNLFLIPLTQSAYDNGAIGAAIATVLTEVFMMGMGLRLLRGVLDRRTLSTAMRCLAASLLMAAMVWAVRDFFIVVPVAVGALAYGAGCLLLRAVDLRDVRVFWSYLVERQRARMVSPGEVS